MTGGCLIHEGELLLCARAGGGPMSHRIQDVNQHGQDHQEISEVHALACVV